MPEVALSKGYTAIVDDADFAAVLAAGKWTARENGHTVYAYRNVKDDRGVRRSLTLHQFLTGFPITDHINGNGLDNRRSNLRRATKAENQRNQRRRSHNTTGFIGVNYVKRTGRFVAYVGVNGTRVHVGSFSNAEDAARARDVRAIELHGAFARLNFPKENYL